MSIEKPYVPSETEFEEANKIMSKEQRKMSEKRSEQLEKEFNEKENENRKKETFDEMIERQAKESEWRGFILEESIRREIENCKTADEAKDVLLLHGKKIREFKNVGGHGTWSASHRQIAYFEKFTVEEFCSSDEATSSSVPLSYKITEKHS